MAKDKKKKKKKSSNERPMKKSKKSGGALKFTVKEPEAPRITEDSEWYEVKFLQAHAHEGNYGPYHRLEFEVLSGEMEDGKDAKGFKFSMFVEEEPCVGNKFHKALGVMADEEIDLDEEIDVTAFYGWKGLALSEQKEKKGTKEISCSVKKIKAKKAKKKKKKKK